MQGCLKVLAGVVALLFVFTAVFTLFLTNLAYVMTDRALVKDALANSERVLIAAAPDAIVEALQQQAHAQGLPDLPLDTAVLAEAVTILAPPGWLSTQTDTAVDTLFDALETGSLAASSIELDARPLLERVQGEPGLQAVTMVVRSLPACASPADFVPQSDAMPLPTCLPPEIDAALLAQQIHVNVVETLRQNPQLDAQVGAFRLPLLPNDALSPESQAAFQRASRTFRLIQQWGAVLWLLPLGCLLLILLLAVRSLREWGNWWGWPLVGTAVITLLFAFVLPAFFTFFWRTAVPPAPTANLILPVDYLLRELAQPLLSIWQTRIFIQAGAMLVAGLLLLLLGALSPTTRQSFP
ncbi:MAG: hypothetical protein IAE79_01820 [Anaerolinea sp.]|nr:hypothetical protein [Anaerolinea sp.]